MKRDLVPSLKQRSRSTLLVTRDLPIPGQIFVKPGDSVEPRAIIARAELPGDVLILKVSEALGIESRDFEAGLKVKVGDSISNQQLLCQHNGLFGIFNSKYFSPCSGVVDFISPTLGHIGLRQASRVIQKNAYSGGKVTSVVEGLSVELETVATIVQGIFGIGGEQQGILKCLNIPHSTVLDLSCLPEDIEGKIIVGGTLPEIDFLKALEKGGAKGLVVGGVDDAALAEFLGYDIGLAITGNEKISFSLVVTEGFGNLALSARVFNLLRLHDGQFACINGTTQIRAGAIRPEVIIPTPNLQTSEENQISSGLCSGAEVRIIRVPYFGAIGRIIDLPLKLHTLENGVHTRVAQIRLDSDSNNSDKNDRSNTVEVPLANIELIT
jgi:hypothetical protein